MEETAQFFFNTLDIIKEKKLSSYSRVTVYFMN